MCLKTSLCRTKVELMSNHFRVAKPEDAFDTTVLEELRATSFMSIALKGTAHSDTVKEF